MKDPVKENPIVSAVSEILQYKPTNTKTNIQIEKHCKFTFVPLLRFAFIDVIILVCLTNCAKIIGHQNCKMDKLIRNSTHNICAKKHRQLSGDFNHLIFLYVRIPVSFAFSKFKIIFPNAVFCIA